MPGAYLGKRFNKEVYQFALYESIQNHRTAPQVEKLIKNKFGIRVEAPTIRKWRLKAGDPKRSFVSKDSLIIGSIKRLLSYDAISQDSGVSKRMISGFFARIEHPKKDNSALIIRRQLANVANLLALANTEMEQIQSAIKRANPRSTTGKVIEELSKE